GAPQSEATPGIFAENTYEFRDTLSKVFGNHGAKFGFEYRKEQNNNNLIGGARPDYSFSGLFNLANQTPIFEGIDASPVTGGPPLAQRYFRNNNFGLFAQDDWKFRPNLTFNLGLRWEYFSPLTEKNGMLTNLIFPPNDLSHAVVQPVDQLYSGDKNNFAPRIGFAWSPKKFADKLVVRGGYGL